MPNFRQRKWLWLAIALVLIIVLTLIAAPNSGGRRNDSGSTYGRQADGYGAWYEYMTQQEVPIQRWRKPFSEFAKQEDQGVTYVQILSKADYLAANLRIINDKKNWVSKGNTLVIVGKFEPTTAAPFSSEIPYRTKPLASQNIKIETTRRYQHKPVNSDEVILGDRYGAVVWQDEIGKGKIIYCVTPYLGANAYQKNPDNYEFLADLVDDRQSIWIDEYVHGYKDKETIAQEQQESALSYLARTPWLLLFIQAILIAAVAALAALRRFGLPIKPQTQVADNSTAYIDALAGVLAKANCTDFVLEAIAKDEQRKLQRVWGLGSSLVDEPRLLAACKQQGADAAELKRILNVGKIQGYLSDAQIKNWLEQWRKFINCS